jgi:uncharacterized membrane protein YfcA
LSVPFDALTFALSSAVVLASYVVFGMSAFGASLFTVPLLSHLMPLETVLPMCVLLDVSAALALGTRFSREADRSELLHMVPPCLLGAILGVTLLVHLPRRELSGALGALEMAYGGTACAGCRSWECRRAAGRRSQGLPAARPAPCSVSGRRRTRSTSPDASPTSACSAPRCRTWSCARSRFGRRSSPPAV